MRKRPGISESCRAPDAASRADLVARISHRLPISVSEKLPSKTYTGHLVPDNDNRTDAFLRTSRTTLDSGTY
jgi:hypothetical protein